MRIFKKNGYWWIDIQRKGIKRQRKKISTWKRVAEEIAAETEAKIIRQEWLGSDQENISFRDFCERYVLLYAQSTLRTSTLKRCRDILDRVFIPRFGDGPLKDIRSQDIQIFIAERATQVGPSTINRELSRLRHIFNKAIEWGCLRSHPMKDIKELREPPGRVRYLSAEERRALLAACEPQILKANPMNAGRILSPLIELYLSSVVLSALHTGMRRSEILSLKWTDVDLRARMIRLRDTKTGDARGIPINDNLYRVFATLSNGSDSPFIFPNISPDQLTMAFRRACGRAGIVDFTFHDLRHDFASQLAMRGTGLRAIQTLLGHRDIRMTIRYSHLSDESLRTAVAQLEGIDLADAKSPGRDQIMRVRGAQKAPGRKQSLRPSPNPSKSLVVPTGIEPVFSA